MLNKEKLKGLKGKAKLAFYLLFVTLMSILLHYCSPARDYGQITGTEVKRVDMKPKEGQGQFTRDVHYIYLNESGDPHVYRNEDTDFGFPFYFKFDSASLQAEAAALQSDNKKMVIYSYGWRIPILSIFPNAIAVTAATEGEGFGFLDIVRYLCYLLGLSWAVFVYYLMFLKKEN